MNFRERALQITDDPELAGKIAEALKEAFCAGESGEEYGCDGDVTGDTVALSREVIAFWQNEYNERLSRSISELAKIESPAPQPETGRPNPDAKP